MWSAWHSFSRLSKDYGSEIFNSPSRFSLLPLLLSSCSFLLSPSPVFQSPTQSLSLSLALSLVMSLYCCLLHQSPSFLCSKREGFLVNDDAMKQGRKTEIGKRGGSDRSWRINTLYGRGYERGWREGLRKTSGGDKKHWEVNKDETGGKDKLAITKTWNQFPKNNEAQTGKKAVERIDDGSREKAPVPYF